MMREVVERLAKRGVVCRRLERVEPRELGSRKRAEIYLGVATDDYYCMVIALRKKSRIVQKEARELMELHRRLEAKHAGAVTRRYLLFDAPLCSKAKRLLEEKGWKVFSLL
jgi:hypothetical protein